MTTIYSRILSNLLLSSLGYAEAEEILYERIKKHLNGENVDLTADITFFHDASFSTVVIKRERIKKVMEEKGFNVFIKAAKITAKSIAAKPTYPSIKDGDTFTVFLPEKTYKEVRYGGEFDNYQELDKFLDFPLQPNSTESDEFEDHYPEPTEPCVYHIAHNQPDEFVFVLGRRDEYIVI